LVCAAATAVGVVAASGCARLCDDPISGERAVCDGNVAVLLENDTCGIEQQVSRTDCATQGLVCAPRPHRAFGYDAACVKPCARDEDCPAGQICDPSVPATGWSSTCQPPLVAGEDCTTQPTHCAQSLVCGPPPPPPPKWDPGVLDASADASADAQTDADVDATADAQADASIDAAAEVDAGGTGTRVCQDDCTHVDPTAPSCLPGAPSTCVGLQIMRCRCGVAAPEDPSVDPCGAACVIAADDGHALCALSSDPDPRCQALRAEIPGFDGSYCDGNAQVQCSWGYDTSRTPCPVGLVCIDTGGNTFCGPKQ
jgi:hypothetical protein